MEKSFRISMPFLLTYVNFKEKSSSRLQLNPDWSIQISVEPVVSKSIFVSNNLAETFTIWWTLENLNRRPVMIFFTNWTNQCQEPITRSLQLPY